MIGSVIKNLFTKRALEQIDSWQIDSQVNHMTFKEELTPIFLKVMQKNSGERTLPNLFCEAGIALIPPKYLWLIF